MELAKCGNINCKSDLQVCQSFVLTKYCLYKIIEVVNYYITLTSFNLDIETHSEKFFFSGCSSLPWDGGAGSYTYIKYIHHIIYRIYCRELATMLRSTLQTSRYLVPSPITIADYHQPPWSPIAQMSKSTSLPNNFLSGRKIQKRDGRSSQGRGSIGSWDEGEDPEPPGDQVLLRGHCLDNLGNTQN